MFLIQVRSSKNQWHKWMSNMTLSQSIQRLITSAIVCDLQCGDIMIKIVDARLSAATEFTGGINNNVYPCLILVLVIMSGSQHS